MKPASKIFLTGLVLVLALLATGCQDKSVGQVLWPDLYDPYFQLTDQWSRSGVIRMGLESEIRFIALLKSKPWRQAYVQRYASLQGLSRQEAEKMLADQMQAHAQGLDVILAATSTYPEHARITHRTSRWEVFLQDQEGRKIEALEIRPMKWSRLELEAYFPAYRQWQNYYTVRFPAEVKTPVTLIVTGPPGRTVLVWDEFQ